MGQKKNRRKKRTKKTESTNGRQKARKWQANDRQKASKWQSKMCFFYFTEVRGTKN
jgi:hypothetical protein